MRQRRRPLAGRGHGHRALPLASALVLGLAAGPARADELLLDGGGARATGRAGIMNVSEDGGVALLVNPAGPARRGDWRLRLGITVSDRDRSFSVVDPDAPEIVDRSGAALAPALAGCGPVGPVVVCAAMLEESRLRAALPEPTPAVSNDDVIRLYPHRYGGLSMDGARHTVAIGASVRAADWLGLGAAVTGSRLMLRELRHIWGGQPADPLFDPPFDLRLELDGVDGFIPGFTAGLLLAPPQVPLELGLSIRLDAGGELAGDAELAPAQNVSFPAPDPGRGRAHLPHPRRAVLRSGLRYLGERLFVELGATVSLVDEPQPWHTTDLGVRAFDGTTAAITTVPAAIAERSRATVGAATDLEVVPGFLWTTAGYAWQSPGTASDRLTPIAGDRGGHTLALGLEGQWSSTTFTVGYARTLATEVIVDRSAIPILSPLLPTGGGDASAGQHRRATDHFALTVELSWD